MRVGPRPCDGNCGETHEHEINVTYEDDEVWQGTCRCCGAEFMEDV